MLSASQKVKFFSEQCVQFLESTVDVVWDGIVVLVKDKLSYYSIEQSLSQKPPSCFFLSSFFFDILTMEHRGQMSFKYQMYF